MSRINPIDLKTTHEGTRKNFSAIERQLGVVPNMMRTMAQSPSALDGYLALHAALSRGLLPGVLQEQLALVVAEANECDYCLSAHTALGLDAGLTEEQVAASRDGRAADGKATAALQFARAVLEERGAVSDQDLARVRAAGFGDGQIAEIIAHVALNVFTNYFNRAAQTEIDFPVVRAGARASLA